jgi:hypothetical protein
MFGTIRWCYSTVFHCANSLLIDLGGTETCWSVVNCHCCVVSLNFRSFWCNWRSNRRSDIWLCYLYRCGECNDAASLHSYLGKSRARVFEVLELEEGLGEM